MQPGNGAVGEPVARERMTLVEAWSVAGRGDDEACDTASGAIEARYCFGTLAKCDTRSDESSRERRDFMTGGWQVMARWRKGIPRQ